MRIIIVYSNSIYNTSTLTTSLHSNFIFMNTTVAAAPAAEGAVLHKSPSSTPENPMPDYASDESDLDPDFDSSQNPESADINDTPTYESSSDDDSPDNDSASIHTEEESSTNLTRPSRARQPVQRYKTTHTPAVAS